MGASQAGLPLRAAWHHAERAWRERNLIALGLNGMPRSQGEPRQVCRRAAKAAYPYAGGSAEAFKAVSEAFERLTRRHR